MSTKLFLELKLKAGEKEKCPLSVDVCLKSNTLKYLHEIVASKTGLSFDQFYLIYRGDIIECGDNIMLEDSGVKENSTIYVVSAPRRTTMSKGSQESMKPSETDIVGLAGTLRRVTRKPNYRQAMQRLVRSETLAQLFTSVQATHGKEKPKAATLALLRDPELLAQLADPEVARVAASSHPLLIEAAIVLVAHLVDQILPTIPAGGSSSTASSSSSSFSMSNVPPTAYSYTLDALSDDEDDEDMIPTAAAAAISSAVSGSAAGPITSEHLAAALASALNQQYQQHQGETAIFNRSGTSATATTTTAATTTTTTTTNSDLSSTAAGTQERNSAQQRDEATTLATTNALRRMNELGFLDDVANLHALQAADWNLDEAVNIILSGVMDDDN